ncbi:glycosyl hydrolase 108 family protein, partial [Xanthovirga aplysinae]|uniref:glycosyl hydrolase 108 family protein n=1 Tax=Xanthovirga aplysinae TaxID=2529853 RepID=UPI0012BCCEDF
YYANLAGDKGGETYGGISRVYWPEWRGWRIIDEYKNKYGPLTNNQRIDNSELDRQIKDFYYSNFWVKIYGNFILDNYIATTIFDSYVNAGINGIRPVQKAVNIIGKTIVVDGIMGPETYGAINDLINEGKAVPLFDTIKKKRESYYISIAKGSNVQFLKGWLNRVDGLPSPKV